MDISGADSTGFVNRMTRNCITENFIRIAKLLADIGTISATVKVKNTLKLLCVTDRSAKRAGCEFYTLSGEAATLLQRYVVNCKADIVKAQADSRSGSAPENANDPPAK